METLVAVDKNAAKPAKAIDGAGRMGGSTPTPSRNMQARRATRSSENRLRRWRSERRRQVHRQIERPNRYWKAGLWNTARSRNPFRDGNNAQSAELAYGGPCCGQMERAKAKWLPPSV